MSFGKLFRNLSHSLVWLFVLLIVGYFILNFLAGKFSGNIIGQGASWVETHSQPGY